MAPRYGRRKDYLRRVEKSAQQQQLLELRRRWNRWLLTCLFVMSSVYLSITFHSLSMIDEPTPASLLDDSLHARRRRASLSRRSRRRKEGLATIAFATSITKCGSEPFVDGAAVLKYAVHKNSVHGPNGGKYDYEMYAIYHPDAAACALPLEDLGYILLERETPVKLNEIQGDFLREKISSNGCCGEKELIKLEAYRLTDYPIVVHVDLDVVLLKPLDPLLDFMLAPVSQRNETGVHLMWTDREAPQQINIAWTKDYGIVGARRRDKPTQGGFLVLKPNVTVYEEFRDIVRKGDYHEKGGWGKLVGPFYGAMTIQGLIPYYYEFLYPGQGIEVNRCIYDQMVDNPRMEKTVNNTARGRCRTNRNDCEDCRNRPLEDIVLAHFTNCRKPWHCQPYKQDIIQMRLCRRLTHEWYRLRSELEASWGRNGTGPGTVEAHHFFGFCEKRDPTGYRPIGQPFGPIDY